MNEEDKLLAENAALKNALVSVMAWCWGGACSDCDMFRAAPARIEFMHAHDCGFLETLNKALALLGRPPQEGHHYDDPKAEMQRLANERTVAYHNRKINEGM